MFYGTILVAYWVFMAYNESYLVFPVFTGFYWLRLNVKNWTTFTREELGFDKVLPHYTGFYWVYWVLLGFT